MGDDGLLSQADIDALTGLMGGGDDGGGSGGSSGGNSGGLDPEIVRPILKLIADQASSVVTTIVSKNVDFKVGTLSNLSDDSVSSFLTDSLLVKVGFENDLQGVFNLVITKATTAVLSDFMMMGDGTAPFEDDHMDALSELINQIMGAVNTAIGTEFELNLSLSQADTTEFKPTDMLSAPYVAGSIDLKVDGLEDVPLLFTFDEKLVSSIEAHLGEPEATAFEPEAAEASAPAGGVDLGAFEEPEFDMSSMGSSSAGLFDSTGVRALDMLMDIPLDLTIELGRTVMSIRRILEMGPGSIVEMDRFAGEPVDLLVNDKVVAKGEVVVVDENFGIRVVSLVTPEERIKFLK